MKVRSPSGDRRLPHAMRTSDDEDDLIATKMNDPIHDMSLTKLRQSHQHQESQQLTTNKSQQKPDFNTFDSPQQPPQKKIKSSEMQENHILLVTVLNPLYPITTETLHTISSPFGEVVRIVIFRKNGVQAMIEFDNVDIATKAKDGLDGADIYAGCCTLRIEYAKPTKLNVYKNDNDSWDYTNPDLNSTRNSSRKEEKSAPSPPRKVLLSDPPPAFSAFPGQTGFSPTGFTNCDGKNGIHTRPIIHSPGSNGFSTFDGFGAPDRRLGFPNDGFAAAAAAAAAAAGMRCNPATLSAAVSPTSQQQVASSLAAAAGLPSAVTATTPTTGAVVPMGTMALPHQTSPTTTLVAANSAAGLAAAAAAAAAASNQHQQASAANMLMAQNHQQVSGCVMMVYGLDADKMNCDRLFNMFCLYGNVIRVKFLKSKEGTAMVQMGDGASVERAIHNLHNSIVFDSKMQLGHSKQAFLADVQQPYELPDGTPSFKDYMGSRNNRFMNAEQASKNRIQPPTKILHFFNTPPGLTEEQLLKVFVDSGIKKPCSTKFFESKSERSSSGLLEFKEVDDALNALVAGNHASIPNPAGGKFPYIMKLCFSTYKKRD